MKLISFEGNNQLTITQSAHGTQNGCAFDFGWGGGPIDKKLYAPCDGAILYHKVQPDGDQYFNFGTTDFYIQFVHDKPLRMGSFKRGEVLGEWAGWTKEPHHHVAINVSGWHWIFDYMDRGTNLYFWTYPNQNNKWAKWTSYPTDLQLPDSETCEVKLAAANIEISSLKASNLRLSQEVVSLTNELLKFKPISNCYQKI